jgi:hypothetical protein
VCRTETTGPTNHVQYIIDPLSQFLNHEEFIKIELIRLDPPIGENRRYSIEPCGRMGALLLTFSMKIRLSSLTHMTESVVENTLDGVNSRNGSVSASQFGGSI